MPRRGLHLFLGPDRPRKLARIQELERALHVGALDNHRLDGAAVSATDLLAWCRQQPASSPARLIVIEQANRLSRPAVEALKSHEPLIAKSSCVVLLVDVPLARNHPLGQIDSCIHREEFLGRDESTVGPFVLIEALGSRDALKALCAIREQFRVGKDAIELLGMIIWQLQRWLTVRRLLDAGCRPEQAGKLIGLRSWQVQRIQSEIASRPLKVLQSLLDRCWTLDVDLKRGGTPAALALEQFVIEVCVAK